MGQLTIEHLSPYLPYGLTLHDIYGNRQTKLLGIKEDEAMLCFVLDRGDEDWANYEAFKPYLRPLSQLTQEIEHNGERFVPAYKINHFKKSTGLYPKGVYPTITGLCDRHINEDLTTYGGGSWEGGLESDIDTFQFYKLYQKLIEWHFDVFGLIEQGLALPIQ